MATTMTTLEKRLRGRRVRNERYTCSHCGSSGWYAPGYTHIVDPRTDHHRPDGRVCRAAEVTK